MNVSGNYEHISYEKADLAAPFLFLLEQKFVSVGVIGQYPGPQHVRPLICLAKLDDPNFLPQVRYDRPDYVLDLKGELVFVPNILSQAAAGSHRAGIVYLSKGEFHLQVASEKGILHLNLQNGELLQNAVTTKEDWTCGGWSIERRRTPLDSETIARFRVQLPAGM